MELVFYLLTVLTIGSAVVVVFSSNIIYSAFSLLGTFGGVAGLYILLGADFVAGAQVLIYVGGILVLILFAVMLTHHIDDRQITNRSVGRVPALVLVGILTFFLVRTITTTVWVQTKSVQYVPTTSGIGEALLSSYLLPFEVASVVLLAALVGSVVIARKELKEESPT
jgi:NADH-quinone oxidoreductase subunit J